MKAHIIWIIASILFVTTQCKPDPEPFEPPDIPDMVEYDDTPYVLNTRDVPAPKLASDNPLTEQGVLLGRMLFYDKKLSRDGTQSCASCHNQNNAFSDTAKFSLGIKGLEGKRQAMAVFNMAWNTNEFFWDGRAHLLRDQSLLPIQDELEMDETLPNVIDKLLNEKSYLDQFKRTFGDEKITELKISLALEQFMNSIISVNSKHDKFLRGEVTLSASEERGKLLFFSEYNPAFPNTSGADCAHCHSNENFENDQYMNNALDSDADMADDGRQKATNDANDRGKFKVTSLRNIAVTPPYMHDGRFQTLEEVVDHYNTGMKQSTTVDPALLYPMSHGGLLLSAQDKEDLVAFLKTLTDEDMLTDSRYSDPF